MKERTMPKICDVCDNIIEDGALYFTPAPSTYVCSEKCHDVHHWRGYIETQSSPRSVRVEGQHYWIANDAPDGAPGFRGFGGRHWRVHFDDGRVIDTRNLWHQGAIPAWAVAEGLTDNAKFASWPVTDNGYVCVEEEEGDGN
jgi:hypothetical protein